MIDLETVRKQAEEEYKHELFREAVEKYKARLREKRSIWDKIFPWKIIIIKKERVDVRH